MAGDAGAALFKVYFFPFHNSWYPNTQKKNVCIAVIGYLLGTDYIPGGLKISFPDEPLSIRIIDITFTV